MSQRLELQEVGPGPLSSKGEELAMPWRTVSRAHRVNPQHTCKELCSVIFTFNICGQLGLSMGVGGIVIVTAWR